MNRTIFPVFLFLFAALMVWGLWNVAFGAGGCVAPTQAIEIMRGQNVGAVTPLKGLVYQRFRQFMIEAGWNLRDADMAMVFEHPGDQEKETVHVILFEKGCAVGEGTLAKPIWSAFMGDGKSA
jgi:hypothetical protein